jgi:hypothetical protein
MANELKIGGTYRHYKTKGLYQAIALVKNTGDGQGDGLMVLYYSFTATCFFVRPLSEFVAKVTVQDGARGYVVPRFELMSPEGALGGGGAQPWK